MSSAATSVATMSVAARQRRPTVSLEFWTINLKKNFSGYIQGMIDAYQKAPQHHDQIATTGFTLANASFDGTTGWAFTSHGSGWSFAYVP